jgi:hypothetical protein
MDKRGRLSPVGSELSSVSGTLATLKRTIAGEIIFWSVGMERRYGFQRKEAVGQVPDRLLKTVYPQTGEEIQTALAETHNWSGGLFHRHASGKLVLTANHWQTHPSVANRGPYVTEVHTDILPAAVSAGDLLVDMLDKIAFELIGSLTAINVCNSALGVALRSDKPDSKQGQVASGLAAAQIARNAQAVHLLQDLVGALRNSSAPT